MRMPDSGCCCRDTSRFSATFAHGGIVRTPLDIAKACYQAYVDKDRAAIEALLSDEYHFSSPLDNALDRETYFNRCWANSGQIAGFDFVHTFEDADRAVVVYEGRTSSGKRF